MKHEGDGVACGCVGLRVCIFRSARRPIDGGLGSIEHDIAHEVHFA